MSENRNREYEQMTVPELEQRLRETFFYTDTIDDTVYQELEQLRTILEQKQPVEFPVSARESWESFARDHGEELERICAASARAGKVVKTRRMSALLRSVLIAAVVVVLLAGAVLAAGPKLWTWVSGWSAPLEPQSTGSPIRQALKDLGITEPLYPSWLPSGYALTEAHISEDPLLLYELYTREDRYISITITPVTAVEKARYTQEDGLAEEYRTGEMAHYLFSNAGSVTAVWYTEHYFVSINGNIYTRALKRIVDSVYA